MKAEPAQCCTIELTKAAVRGVRHIQVDGVVWGEIIPYFRGPSGAEYRFRQKNQSELIKDGGSQFVSVATDALHRRRERISRGAPIDSLDDRLLARVRELIALGSLRHPAEVERIAAEAKRVRRAKIEAREKREREAFTTRAQAAIRASALPETDQLLAEIIKAMEWAQTR